jgi:flagellar L-ring protein precursor FlgH
MKRLIFVVVVLSLTRGINAQDMRKNAFSSLFSDTKANHKGDAITIIVTESTNASNNSQTSAGRKSDLSLNLSANTGKTPASATSLGLQTGNDFSGQGSTQTTGAINTKISAVVDSVLENGNLIIVGNKKISINGEDQVIHIKGTVRTPDIQPDNSVLSYNISNAEISFEGNGIIDNAQRPGLLTKFFHWLF